MGEIKGNSREKKLTWSALYDEAGLYKSAVRLYTKPLFNWRKAMSNSTDKRTLYDFARSGLKNLHTIHHRLKNRNFHFRPGLALHHNLNGKKRTMYIYPWEERLVDLLLYRAMNLHLHRWFSPVSYAYRINGWGVDRCQRRLARKISGIEGGVFVVKRDIRDYFASVDHDILLDRLADLVDGEDYLYELLRQRVRFAYYDSGREQRATRGIPFGTAVACLFANLYLTILDRRLEALPRAHTFRYADDILVVASARSSALQAARIMEETFDELKLESKKSHELNVLLADRPGAEGIFIQARSFRHLGLEFRADGTVGLSRDKTRKIRNLFRYAFRRRRAGFRRLSDPVKRAELAIRISRDVLEKGVRNVAIIDYYLRHVEDERQLGMIDRWLAEEVLSLSFGGGHRKGYFGRISFRRLRGMGLPSLVHRRRLLRHGHLESSFFLWKNARESRWLGGRRPGLPAVVPEGPSLPARKQQAKRPREGEGLPVDGSNGILVR